MKSLVNQIVFILILLLVSVFLDAQSAQEIIEKHIAAHGGAEAWSKVESMKVSGLFTAFSEEKEFASFKTKEGAFYSDYSLGKFQVIEAFDGEDGWILDPWQDIFHARNLSSNEKYIMQQKAVFCTPFFNYKEKGFEVEFLAKEKMDGKECYVLKLIYPNGKTQKWFLDSQTYLEYLCETEWVDFAYPTPSEVYFDDFREIEGLVIPFYMDRTFLTRNRVHQIEEVIINPDIDWTLWEKPVKKEMEKLSFLAGDWAVSCETVNYRGMLVQIGNYDSEIFFKDPGLLEENFSYERLMPITRTTTYSFHDELQKYRMTTYHDLFTSIDVFEGEMTDSLIVFNDPFIARKCEDITELMRLYRYQIGDITENGFILEFYYSSDQGENWQLRDRFTYTRK